jgi:Mg-chelatase subunit ChlD
MSVRISFFLILFTAFFTKAFAQKTPVHPTQSALKLQIKRAEPKDNAVFIYLNARDSKTGKMVGFNKKGADSVGTTTIASIVVHEIDAKTALYAPNPATNKGGYPKNMTGVKVSAAVTTADPKVETVAPSVLFLLDVSGSMKNDNKLQQAKDAIRKTLEENKKDWNKASFASFSNTCSAVQTLSLENFDAVVGALKPEQETALNYSLQRQIENLKKDNSKAKKVIIVLTDGKNDIAKISDEAERKTAATSHESVLSSAGSVEDNFAIYTIGLGKDVDSLKLREISDKTPYKSDGFLFAAAPNLIAGALKKVANDLSENIVFAYLPTVPVFSGEPRKVRLTTIYGKDTLSNEYEYRFGSSGNTISVANTNDKYSLITLSMIGLCLLGCAFFFFLVVLPAILFSNFRRKYVKKFKTVQRKTKTGALIEAIDPVTTLPIEPDEDVVTKCQEFIPLMTWQDQGNKCPNYGKCAHNCPLEEGRADLPLAADFFAQKGSNKRYNWLVFGLIGGLLGWFLLSLTEGWSVGFLEILLNAIFDPSQIQQVTSQIWVGWSLGTALSLLLSWVEERGQSRTFSVQRVVLRAVLGGLLAIPVFIFGEWAYIFIGNFVHDTTTLLYVGRLVSWLIFGSVLGLIVAIKSSIELKNGFIGGIIASFVAFHAYFLLPLLSTYSSWLNSGIAELISYMLYGAILGWIINKVVETLEDFWVEVISPTERTGLKFAISKWLKGGQALVKIGTGIDCEVRVKWIDDAAAAHHASMRYDGRKVYILPIGETLLNDRIITAETILQDNDRIKLGRQSNSVFIFKTKTKTQAAPPAPSLNETLKGQTPQTPIIRIRKLN